MKITLKALDPNGCCQYDGIPASILIKCTEHLAFPLATVFNMSIEKGDYPSILKYNNVILIFKPSGVKNDISSSCGISMQPIVAKVFERLINIRLHIHLKQSAWFYA